MNIPQNRTVWMAPNEKSKLVSSDVEIPKLKEREVLLEVLSCGICHSDIHLIDNDWGISTYPLVPGHEIIGKVVSKGNNASLNVGTVVGVGWQRSACLECEDCVSSSENTCEKKTATCVEHVGGYSNYHITDSRFAFEMPSTNPALAPLLCGGATVYSPLCLFANNPKKHFSRVGIVGLGGLGNMAVKMANKMGYEVTVFSSSKRKQQEAEKMGAHHFVSSLDENEIMSLGRKLDLVLVTANVDLNWGAFLNVLKTDGTLCFVGIPPSSFSLNVIQLLDRRLRVAASPIASVSQIRNMISFCDRNEIVSEIETFKFQDVNAAVQKVRENKAHFRAVLVK